MYLLQKRKSRKGTLFQAISSSIVFAFATVSAVVGTVLLVVASFVGSSSSTPQEINVRACSWKVVAAPMVAILAETGMYWAGLRQYVKIDYGTDSLGGSGERAKVLRQSMFSTTTALILSTVAHTLLTTLIAGRIWWMRRQFHQVVTPDIRVANLSGPRKYDSVIALTVESGMIIPIFEIIFIAYVTRDTNSNRDAAKIMAFMLPQVIAFAPLLVMVRVGLGLTVERDDVSELTNTTSLAESSRPHPRFLSIRRDVRVSVTIDPSSEIELNLTENSALGGSSTGGLKKGTVADIPTEGR
ncbi:hypothetical protein AAF712_013235 [Marasmius tenuissimus]|uniref:Uncharacterized protein n=1 Tax=Marasmius tenuissimus TaxID=585030 RepID=A0ABR2ZGB8_9AGAR